MPNPVRLPYLWTPVIKGRRFAYYRRGNARARLPGVDTPGFLAAYSAAHEAAEAQARPVAGKLGPLPGSMAALVAAYRESTDWRQLATATRASYGAFLDHLAGERFGRLPVGTLPRAFVFKLREQFAVKDGKPTPRRANHIVAVLRLLMSWAVDHGWRRDNPALRTGRLKTGPGYAPWSPEAVALFMTCPAIGEPLKRALAVGLYTAQRKSDCLAMTRAARAGGGIAVVQEKTGAVVWIPEHPFLTRVLDAAPAGGTHLLTRPDGKPWLSSHFTHQFAAAVKLAGLSGLSFHGLRKAFASRLAEAGCSANEIMAITGHRTVGEVTRYTAGADQRSRATAAIGRLPGSAD